MLCENFKIQFIIFIRNFEIYNREYLPRTISEKFKNSQTRQIPEDYISKFSKPRISRGPEKSRNSQIRISKTIFQNCQNHEYHTSKEKFKNSQRFSKLNFAIIARKLYFKIFKITNFTSHRNRNDPKVTNITSHEDEKNIKILKDQNFEDCISKLSKSRISRGPEKFSSQNFEDYISKFSESRISHLTMARKIQKFSKILKISRLPQL